MHPCNLYVWQYIIIITISLCSNIAHWKLQSSAQFQQIANIAIEENYGKIHVHTKIHGISISDIIVNYIGKWKIFPVYRVIGKKIKRNLV